MIKNIGLTEILVVAAILFILFGGKKLTEIAKGLGESTREIKKAKKEFDKTVQGGDK